MFKFLVFHIILIFRAYSQISLNSAGCVALSIAISGPFLVIFGYFEKIKKELFILELKILIKKDLKMNIKFKLLNH